MLCAVNDLCCRCCVMVMLERHFEIDGIGGERYFVNACPNEHSACGLMVLSIRLSQFLMFSNLFEVLKLSLYVPTRG
jgi:hypothetical protein